MLHKENIEDYDVIVCGNKPEYDVKSKKLMSQPAVLALYEAETDRKWAEKGVSRYGNNNIFGSNAASIIKGLK